MTDLLQRVENSIQNRTLIRRGEKFLVAVSGGLDSMALLHILHALAEKWRWKIVVAHFNHQLRGRASDADERLVRKAATTMKLPFVVGCADVKQFARRSKLSIEMAARKLRHEFFARIAQERKIQTIALAHHADDQVELFFLRLLRGAGGEGLAGMKWRSPSLADPKITLVRPLLDATKAGLCGFACENRIQFREDATNATLDIPRNRIRKELLPLLRKNYQPALSKTVLRLMEIIGAESHLAGDLAGKWLKKPKADFEKLPVAIQRRVLQLQLIKLNALPDFDLTEQLRKSVNFPVSISPTLSVLRDTAGKVNLRTRQTTEFNPNELAVNLAGRAGGAIFGGANFNWSFIKDLRMSSPRQIRREFFDAGRVGNKIILRHWRAGDRFQPIGLKSAVKLQDLFTNQKIPQERRRKLIVATTAMGEIFWVEGLRMSENFKLTPQTKRRLVWRW